MQSDQSIIGSVERISLPEFKMADIPAKIDTGADSSAIWAGEISEHSDKLSFVLFDKSSPHYTGEKVTTDEYEVISVKNSFGHAEYRYKVRLNTKLAGRNIRAKFTLADRSNNRYPVLIGRKTLHGKFLVDVTKKPAGQVRQVLMLSTKRTDVTQRYADNITSKDVQVTYASYADLDYYVGLPQARVMLRDTGRDIAEFDLVYFKTTARFMDVAAATARYLENHNVQFIDEAIKHFPATSKLYQYMLLEHSDMLVPKSIFMLPVPLAASYDKLSQELGLPFILKDIHGNKGQHNYLVTDEASFTQACVAAAEDDVQCVAQGFIANDSDYRVLVFGNKIALVIERTRTHNDTHLNNTSQGATAAIVPANALPPSLQKACLQSARLVERQVAGVDVVREKHTGAWYCLEVNDGPQLASGSFVEEKHKAFADYLQRKLA